MYGSFKTCKIAQREPTFKEIAAGLELSPDQIDQFRQYDKSEISLDSVVKEEKSQYLHESLSDPNETDPSEIIQSEQLEKQLDKALLDLDSREREILKKRYGFENEHADTLSHIGQEAQLTRERVRQIQLRSIRHLRENR